MCGHCKENHSPSPYSYQLKCAHCSHYKYSWLKYLVMAYLPLTIFFLVVVFFRFSALSAPMNAFIFFSQIVSSPSVMTLMSTFAYFRESHSADHIVKINVIIVLKILASAFGIWNLDFFVYCTIPIAFIQIYP